MEGRPTPQCAEAELGFWKNGSADLADLGNVFREAELEEAVERRVYDGDMVAGTHRLSENIFHASCLEDGANAAAGDQTGTGRRRLEHDATAIVLTEHIVRDG